MTQHRTSGPPGPKRITGSTVRQADGPTIQPASEPDWFRFPDLVDATVRDELAEGAVPDDPIQRQLIATLAPAIL